MTASGTADNLKPCPFCGWPHIQIARLPEGRRAFCKRCQAAGSPSYAGAGVSIWDAEARAVEKWNNRAETSDG